MQKRSLKLIFAFTLIFLFTVIVPSFAFADSDTLSSFVVTTYTSDSGIPTGEANTALQTSDGYIWIGTYGGLIRYDGVSFEKMNERSGLDSDSIRSLFESSDGKLYVGTNDKGAYVYDGKSFTSITNEENGKMLSVRCFGEDINGRIWTGCTDGLGYIEDGRAVFFDLEKIGLSNSMIYTLSTDRNGCLWCVDYGGNAFAVDTKNEILYKCFSPGKTWDEGVYAYSAFASSDGYLYVGTDLNRIYKIDPKSEESTPVESGSLWGINAICESSQGEIWLCGDVGIGYIDADGFHDCSYLDNTEHLLTICEDYERNIWCASNKYGALHVKRVGVEHLINAPQLKDSETYTVCPYAGKWFIGSEKGLLVAGGSDSESLDELVGTLNEIQVHHIVAGDDGKLYMGTFYNGLYIYDSSDGSITQLDINGNRCRCVRQLKTGEIAVGTDSGVSLVRDGEVVREYKTTSRVLNMLETQDGGLLCGTDGSGLVMIRNGRVSPYADKSAGLSGLVILRTAELNGKYFVSCGSELFYGNDEGFYQLRYPDLGSGSVLDIFPDGDSVWILRSSGIIVCNREKLLSGFCDTAEMYLSNKDGIPGPLVANAWPYFNGERLVLCTTDGVGVYEKKSAGKNPVAPKGLISEIRADDDVVLSADGDINLDKNVGKISIAFSTLSYSGDDSKAEFYLEGLDSRKQQRDIRSQHSVEYTNLKAGDYTFHFTPINSDGVRGEEKTVRIVKEPKFSETIWFPISLVAATGLLVWLAAFLRIRTVKKKEQLYKDLTEQTIDTISGAIDAKDPYTEGHSQRVADFSVKIAERMGMGEGDRERLRYVALLHDIGKIGVPDSILKKPEKLTDEEFAIIKSHAQAGGDILSKFTVLPGVADGARYHHERYDGKGYGSGLKGDEIPIFARIISVADSYDAMNSSRCYRKALDKSVIISELEKGRGTQFDPRLVDIALDIIKEEMQQEQN